MIVDYYVLEHLRNFCWWCDFINFKLMS